jgi:hypothetical protein
MAVPLRERKRVDAGPCCGALKIRHQRGLALSRATLVLISAHRRETTSLHQSSRARIEGELQ